MNQTSSEALMPMDDQPARPQYIREQHNSGCQQFFGPITGCIFAMPGATVHQNSPSVATQSSAPTARHKPKGVKAKEVKEAQAAAVSKTCELMTFASHGVLDANLTLFYQQLVSDRWIDADTAVDDFLALFSGQRSECKVIWSGKYGKGTLVFLFRMMELEGLISTPQGFSLPNILMGHFVDHDGHYLTHLDKGDAPAEKAGKEVQEYINILKYKATKHIRKTMVDDDLPTYGEDIDPYDHQDLNLHRRH